MPRKKPPQSPIDAIESSYQQARKRLEDSIAHCSVGTVAYANHIKMLADLDRRHRSELVERGITPAHLGPERQKGYLWLAHQDAYPTQANSAEEFVAALVAEARVMTKRLQNAGYFNATRVKTVTGLEAEFGDNNDVCGPALDSFEGEDKK